MSSPLLALFIRSLREDGRQSLTYIARSGLALVILLFLFSIQGIMGAANAPGLVFFTFVIAIDVCFVVLAGIGYFSSAISEEKEEMTLGLLRMTNLNPLSILLGKSTSRLCTAILLFAAQIPFTMLAITLGGISPHQVLAAYVAVASFLIFVSNLALLGSVICRRTATAAIFTGFMLFLFLALVPIAAALATLPVVLGLLTSSSGWVVGLNAVADWAKLASPFPRLGAIFTTGFRESAFSFQAVSNLVLGLAFFLLAWLLFERFCGEQKEAAPARLSAARGRGQWHSLNPGRTWRRALAWKDFHFLSGGKLWLVLKFLIFGLPLLAARCWPQSLGGPPPWEACGFGMFGLMIGFIVIELAFTAATVFRAEHQGQTLSCLAMLPKGTPRVAYEKLLGILPSLAPAGIYLVLSLPIITARLLELNGTLSSTNRWWAVAMLGSSIVQLLFFLHLVASLSLRLRRGALPVAIGVHFLLSIFVGITSIALFREGTIVVVPALYFGATVFLHINTGHRLVELAAEE